MLNLFRKHATSWLIKIALFLIVIVFIFWGGYAYKSMKETQIARVDDQYIGVPEYNRSYDQMVEMYRRQLGGSFSEEMIKQFNLKQQALDVMINRIILTKAAGELGLTATNQEVQQKILDYPVFKSDGKFDQNRYTAVLRQNHMTPETFEMQMRTDLTAQKLEAFIKRRAAVSPEEVVSDFQFHFNRIRLAYVLLDPKFFEDKVSMDETAIEDFYKSHQDQYKDPEKRQIAYVLFKGDAYAGEVKISDNDVRQYYEDNRDEYHKEMEVRARHILFPVKEGAPEEEVNKVKEEAQKVLEEAKKGKDFAALAKKYSKDPGSAKEGGDLGYFSKERMVPAFSNAAFSLKPGEISNLVRTNFGFHIIKVEDIHPEKTETLDEVKPKIETKLKEERSRDLAYKKAREFADLAYSQRDIQKSAKSQNLTVSGTETWVAKTDSLAGVEPTGPVIMGKLFDLKEKETSGVVEVPQGFLVAQVEAIQPPQVLPLEKVKAKVMEEFRAEQSRVLAKEKGTELLQSAKKEKSLESAAKPMGLEVVTSDWFSRREPDKGLKLMGEALNAAFRLDDANPFPTTVLDLQNRYLVCQLLGKKDPDKDLEKERPSILKRVEQQKQATVWQAWVEAQRKKAHIEIYKEL